MHELSIALSIVEGVEEEARLRGATQVTSVHLRVGELTGVVPEALLFAYDQACAGTLLEGSELRIETAPVVLRCESCHAEAPAASAWQLWCSRCGQPGAEVVQGRELQITAMEIL